MMIFDNRLHSCPLCGAKDVYLEEKIFGNAIQIDVGCAKCGLKGSKSFLSTAKDKEEKVIEYWNHRVPATVPLEEFDAHKTVVGKRIDVLGI